MRDAGWPAGHASCENNLLATLVDAHTVPTVDAGSIPAASIKTPVYAGVL